ncbi:(2Fe-2S) ferredoxin domain-containing protein [Fervidobacterium sp.]
MDKIKVYVCVVGCCKENGGEELLKQAKHLIHKLNMEERFEVFEAECLGTCKFRPSVMVSENGKNFYYGNVTLPIVETIINYHSGIEKNDETLKENLVKVETCD